MSVHVRPASLQDGVAVLELLEQVGYYPEPISFAKTYRKTLTDPHFLVRVAEADGKIVGMASMSLRWQLGLGGLLACLDELAVARGLQGRGARAVAGDRRQGALARRPPRGHESERRDAPASRRPDPRRRGGGSSRVSRRGVAGRLFISEGELTAHSARSEHPP